MTSEGRPAADEPATRHRRPAGVSGETVAAVGKLTEAWETTMRARGHLYSFHQLTGSADLALGEAVEAMRDAGDGELADAIERELVGRNVLAGRWTFQVVEEYDDGYFECFTRWEQKAREQLMDGRRHVYEAEMKEDRRSQGERHHEAQPGPEADPAGV